MPNSAQTKLCKALFRELPYNGQNIRQCHGLFNNLMPIENLPSKKYLDHLPSLNDIDLCEHSKPISVHGNFPL